MCDTAYVTILITDTAQVGCVVAQTIEDTAVEVCATDKVEFVIGSIQVVTAPVNGTLNPIVGNPSCLTYTPNANYCGNDDFTMLVCDALGEICDTVCAVIQITCVNDTPVANNDDLTDVQDCISPADTATIPVLANDTDPDGDLLLIIWVQTPTQQGGTATINTTGDSIIYTPPTGFEGTDSFSYVIQDPDGLTDTALVSICISTDTIDQVIDAVNDTVTTPFNTDLTIDILDNDSYPSGIITVTIITPPQQGVVTNPGDGTPINYNPEDDYEGVDSFQYVLCVQTNPDDPATKICDTAWVYITIEPKPECVLVPANGFSPNGDNKNDCWYISNIANFEICNPGAEVKLLIFNRWGDLMYCPETVNEECVWDGNWQTNGEPAPEGTYYYVITVKPEAGVIEKYNGFIELMR
ncbi:MAG: tandem-95 repeat protein [Sphingobacteriales bacterium]|nr:tandem-95 repeat protein [Sphingobacteriales bacterium]